MRIHSDFGVLFSVESWELLTYKYGIKCENAAIGHQKQQAHYDDTNQNVMFLLYQITSKVPFSQIWHFIHDYFWLSDNYTGGRITDRAE